MDTIASTPLQKDTYVKAVDSTDEEFFIFNPTSQTMYVKFTSDDVAPTETEGAITLLPHKGMQRGTVEGYPWLLGVEGTKASITE